MLKYSEITVCSATLQYIICSCRENFAAFLWNSSLRIESRKASKGAGGCAHTPMQYKQPKGGGGGNGVQLG